ASSISEMGECKDSSNNSASLALSSAANLRACCSSSFKVADMFHLHGPDVNCTPVSASNLLGKSRKSARFRLRKAKSAVRVRDPHRSYRPDQTDGEHSQGIAKRDPCAVDTMFQKRVK